MPDRFLEQQFNKVWEAAIGPVGARQRRAVDAALNDDATVRREAIIPSLPWSVRDIAFPGAVATGANLRRLAMPQGARIRHVGIGAGTVPSGGPFTITVSAGAASHSFSLPAGASTALHGVDLRVDPGAFVGISVTAANGAANVSISMHYSVGDN